LGHIKVADTTVLAQQVLCLGDCLFQRGKRLQAYSTGGSEVSGSCQKDLTEVVKPVDTLSVYD